MGTQQRKFIFGYYLCLVFTVFQSIGAFGHILPGKGIMGAADYQQLLTLASTQWDKRMPAKDHAQFYGIIKPSAQSQLIAQIQKAQGIVYFVDVKTGFCHFQAPPSWVLNKVEQQLFSSLSFDKKLEMPVPKFQKVEGPETANQSPSADNRISPQQLLGAEELTALFPQQFGKKLDGSSSTLVVIDTGLDLARTDVFQGRIRGLYSLRNRDIAILKTAREENIDGVDYLTATVLQQPFRLIKTPRLSLPGSYYLGFFSEKQFATGGTDYRYYDFNQNGKDHDVYPVVVHQTIDNKFIAYINVNSKLNYPDGDESIEDEIPLQDYNATSEQFFSDNQDPLASYYLNSTLMDIADGQQKDRRFGKVKLAVTMEVGRELNANGDALAAIANDQGEGVHRIGLVGIDLEGHGTHVAGIGAGNFQSYPAFSSIAPAAGIVSIALLGGGQVSEAELLTLLIKVVNKYPNPVVNMSYGSSSPLNDSLNMFAQVYDKIISTLNVPVVKAAGNEGPGLKTHSMIISQEMIAVANYFSTDSRHYFSQGNFEGQHLFVDPTSSRGPLIDGSVRPDIGAPGWVLSAVPFSRPLGSNQSGSFRYYPGTSMAAPSAASVLLLMFDALVKSTLANPVGVAPLSLSLMKTAMLNSAQPYEAFSFGECRSPLLPSGNCDLKPQLEKVLWHDGGAGRIHATKFWEILTQLVTEKGRTYQVRTNSWRPDYPGEALGVLAINQLRPRLIFELGVDAHQANYQEDVRLEIPSSIDWLSFDQQRSVKVKEVPLFTSEKTAVVLYLDQSKLLAGGRILPGIHQAIVKGYSLAKGAQQGLFRFLMPVTILGYDTHFDPWTDNFQFNSRGHIPTGQYRRFFLPISSVNQALSLDLRVSAMLPGAVRMKVFHQGMPVAGVGTSNIWAISDHQYGEGREQLRFQLANRPAGLYEVILESDHEDAFVWNEVLGSYYDFAATTYALRAQDVIVKSTSSQVYVELAGLENVGPTLRIASAQVIQDHWQQDLSRLVKLKEEVVIDIEVGEEVEKLVVATNYLGDSVGMDLDFAVLDEDGKTVLEGGGFDANERGEIENIQPGKYRLVLQGYKVDPIDGTEFNIHLEQYLKTPVVLAAQFTHLQSKLPLAANVRMLQGEVGSFTTTFPQAKIKNLQQYKLPVKVQIKAFVSNEINSAMSVFEKQMSL